jgi:hypothetical protein
MHSALSRVDAYLRPRPHSETFVHLCCFNFQILLYVREKVVRGVILGVAGSGYAGDRTLIYRSLARLPVEIY